MAANIERITEMENNLNACTQAIQDLTAQLDTMEALRERMIALFRYYGSEEWYEDREGELPAGLSAGVLGEDPVYDAITDVRDAAFRMLDLASDILKNRS